MGNSEIPKSLTGAAKRPDWASLRAFHPSALVTALQVLEGGGGHLRITADDLSGRANTSESAASRLLDELASSGWLRPMEQIRCPDIECGAPLSEPPKDGAACPICRQYFADIGPPIVQVVYSREEPRPRLIEWLVTLHGMNTRGDWQQKLNWLVSLAYGRAIPIEIYKYGMIRPGVLFRWRQRQLRDKVIRQIRAKSQEIEPTGRNPKPDVIAHSFGTWLLAHALQYDPQLKVGRVILTGSVLRPDFDWQTLIENGQVEAVLNHCGGRDFPVAITHFFIPDSGPAGRRGFDTPGPLNVSAPQFKHSTFFGPDMEGAIENVWIPFLTSSNPATCLQGFRPTSAWREAPWLLRANLGRRLVIGGLVAFAASAARAFILGIRNF
jgi:hypothetical protein